MSTHRHLCAALLGCCITLAVVRPARAQNAPPVDQAEGGAVAGAPLRLGSAVFSGSLWLDGSFVANQGADDPPDTFRVRRGRLGIAGTLSPRLGYSLSAELTAQPALRNAFLVVHLSDHTSLRVGQANPISALERGSSALSLELIERSGVTNELSGPADVGLTLFSTEPYRKWLGYAFNLNNGSGFNKIDNNDSKDVSGRVAVSPPAVPGLLVVVSGARGEQPKGLRTRAGLGVDLRRGPWHLLAEGLRQRRDNLPVSDGYVAMAAYRYQPAKVTPDFTQLEVAARVWVLNDRATAAGVPSGIANDDGGDALASHGIVTTREFQAGVNYYFTPNVRLMGDVVVPFDERSHPGPSGLFRWQVQF